jgi:membrane associated rhomboid family serine protease
MVSSLASGLSSLPRTLSSRAHSPAPLSEPLLSSDAASVACETVAMTPHTPRSSPDDESKQGAKQDLGSTNPKVRVHRAYFCGFMIVVDLSVLIYSIYLNGWAFESFNRNPMLGPSASVLTHLGAKDTPLIREGQWYRLLSAMFLHAGIAHFCFNSFSLWRVGKPLEELYGPWRIAILFLVSGLSGNMLSEW